MKRIKYLLAAVCFLILLSDGKTQEVILSRNSVFFEVFGNGGLYSINYERGFTSNLYGRLGFATWATFDIMDRSSRGRITTFPVLVTYFTGHKKSHFEAGGGFLFGEVNDYMGSKPIVNLTTFIGYRYQSPCKGMLFRIGLTPFLSLDNKANYPDKFMLLDGGLSIGYHF